MQINGMFVFKWQLTPGVNHFCKELWGVLQTSSDRQENIAGGYTNSQTVKSIPQ